MSTETHRKKVTCGDMVCKDRTCLICELSEPKPGSAPGFGVPDSTGRVNKRKPTSK